MSWLGKVLRHILVWLVPGLLLLCVLACGFAGWLVASQTGTSLLLNTALNQFGGHAEAVEGSLLRGVHIGRYTVVLPGVSVDASDFTLAVTWSELWQRRLHVRELSAGALHIALTDSGAAPAGAEQAGGPPTLPVAISVDRLAVADFTLTHDGQPVLPVTLGGLQATVDADAGGARLRVAGLRVGHPMGQADVQAQVNLQALADPWPLTARVLVGAHGSDAASPLCMADAFGAPAVPVAADAARKAPSASSSRKAAPASSSPSRLPSSPASVSPSPAPAPVDCVVALDLQAEGSLQDMNVTLTADGSGATLALRAALAPRAAMPVRDATLDLRLPDKSGASATLAWSRTADGVAQRIRGTLATDGLDAARWLAGVLPPALLSARATFDAELSDAYVLRVASVDMDIGRDSRWNRQPLTGVLHADVATGARENPGADWPAALTGIRIDKLDTDLRLGRNRIQARGSMGPGGGSIDLNAAAPELAALWPGLNGGATLQGKLAGTPARHQADLRGSYTPANARPGVVGRAKADLALTVTGGWGPGTGADTQVGWRGTVARLTAEHAGFQIGAERPVTVAFLPQATAPAWQWQVGAAVVDVGLPGGERFTLRHTGSRGGTGRWETGGSVDGLVLTPATVRAVHDAVAPPAKVAAAPAAPSPAARRGGSSGASSGPGSGARIDRRIVLDASWDLKFAGTLSGRARLVRRSGDLRIPGDRPIALGLRALTLDITATPLSATSSRVNAVLDLATDKMGAVKGNASAVVGADRDGGLALAPRQPITAHLDADISDLSWLELFTGDSFELGGSLKANIDAQGSVDGPWQAHGSVNGRDLRLVRIDDGVRLVDGTLSARLQDDRFILESLRFPASLRVIPRDARTRDWITKNPDAKNGYIEASGEWNLTRSAGKVHTVFYRFPILQRADRYAMVSGQVDVDADLPRMSITGNLKADAGWASLEVLSEVPTLDDDVKIYRAGVNEQEQSSTPLQISMNLSVDLGSRFYITGMGLDAGLGGTLLIRYVDQRLTGTGALATRSGRIDAYGQRLELRRGTITFQGSLDNPLLDIEALRTGEQVEAGVRVSGTARRPRIDLVSYPDVSDVEKLSWLVLGRAPDASGNDTALLLSVGTALLGGGEPFYKQFGLDDVSVRTGAIGTTSSLLPDRTVASDVNMNTDTTLATQFLVASKNFSNGITLSVEQALAGADTVGRVSYRLARNWSVDLKGGAVNGIELIYRKFFK